MSDKKTSIKVNKRTVNITRRFLKKEKLEDKFYTIIMYLITEKKA